MGLVTILPSQRVLALYWALLEYVTHIVSFKLWAGKQITTFPWYKREDRRTEKTPRTEFEPTQPASRAQRSRAASLRSPSYVPRTECHGGFQAPPGRELV